MIQVIFVIIKLLPQIIALIRELAKVFKSPGAIAALKEIHAAPVPEENSNDHKREAFFHIFRRIRSRV